MKNSIYSFLVIFISLFFYEHHLYASGWTLFSSCSEFLEALPKLGNKTSVSLTVQSKEELVNCSEKWTKLCEERIKNRMAFSRFKVHISKDLQNSLTEKDLRKLRNKITNLTIAEPLKPSETEGYLVPHENRKLRRQAITGSVTSLSSEISHMSSARSYDTDASQDLKDDPQDDGNPIVKPYRPDPVPPGTATGPTRRTMKRLFQLLDSVTQTRNLTSPRKDACNISPLTITSEAAIIEVIGGSPDFSIEGEVDDEQPHSNGHL